MKTTPANHLPAPSALSLTHRPSLLAALLITALAPATRAQTYNFYGFSTDNTNFATPATATTNVSPTPPSGTNVFRVGSSGGSILITNDQIATLGTNSELRLVAGTNNTSFNTFSVFDIASASSTFYLKQFVAFGNTNYDGTATDGNFVFATGNGPMFTNGIPAAASAHTGLRFSFGASGTLAISNFQGGSGFVALPGTGITQTNVFALEVIGNNSGSATNYNYGGLERSLTAYTYDLWVDGTLVASNIAKAALANDTSIDSFEWYSDSSTGNAAAVFVDSITYATSIGTNSGRTFWTTNGAAAKDGTWGTVGTSGATVGWGATATVSEGSPWVQNNTAVFSANDTYTVTVTNTVRAANLEFLAGTPTLTNGTIELSFSNAEVLVTNGVTANVASAIAGTNGFRKTGTGSLTLSGAAANTYTGATIVSAGTLELDKTVGTTAVAGALTVSNSATLLISADSQVADTSAVTLSGGTIARGSGVDEVFGALNLTVASFLDYGTGAIGTLQFGTYAPTSLLTVNNFLEGNVLIFGSDLTSTINNASLFDFDNGFISDWNVTNPGLFTITAIPEPSTYVAAAGLLGLMMWPSRRRMLKDAKRILGLRAPTRDRLARLRA